MGKWRGVLALAAALAVAGLLVAGCGDDDDDATTGGGTPEAAGAIEGTVTSSDAGPEAGVFSESSSP